MLDLTSLENAVQSLETAIDVADNQTKGFSDEIKQTIRAGVIQNFEFTYELCWKFMKRWLGDNLGSAYVDGVNRRELFRLAVEHHLISDVDAWMDYHEQRNETAHTYDKTTAEEVFEAAKNFIKNAQEFLVNLKKRNA